MAVARMHLLAVLLLAPQPLLHGLPTCRDDVWGGRGGMWRQGRAVHGMAGQGVLGHGRARRGGCACACLSSFV